MKIFDFLETAKSRILPLRASAYEKKEDGHRLRDPRNGIEWNAMALDNVS